MQDINPRNRSKTKFYFFLRSIEDQIKNFFLFSIVFLSLFFKIKSKGKEILNLGNYIDVYSINYIIFSLSPKYFFTYDFRSGLKLIKRLGLKNFIRNCKPNFLYKKYSIKVFYNKKEKLDIKEINFNFDYFKPFDHNNFDEINEKKSMILPYYASVKLYKQNLFQKYIKYRNNKKKFQIIFSGSNHPDWYEQFKWQISYKNKNSILSRCQILNFVNNEFKNDIQIIDEKKQINKISDEKKILFIISNPSKKRKLSKILSMEEHMKLISSSKFFLTCPGTAMPLCHHIIESMFVGTVPITLYGNLLFPQLDNSNSLIFKNYSELYKCVERALTINDSEFDKMRKQTIYYYDNNLSPSNFLNKFQSFNPPFNLYMNVDGHSLDARRERLGLSRLFPLPSNYNI